MSNSRAKDTQLSSPLWRGELIVTSRCNFTCCYCRGVKSPYQGDISEKQAISIIDSWLNHGLKNIRFSGGEPLLYPNLDKLVWYSKINGIERIAISSNGSFDPEQYLNLVEAGVNDFSISLDGCCASTLSVMNHTEYMFDLICSNILLLAQHTYVSVGVVLTADNEKESEQIIHLASNLGVADIRIIPAAQSNNIQIQTENLSNNLLSKHPILKYRIQNLRRGLGFRGLNTADSPRCYLVNDDIMSAQNYHFPCIIYFREGGEPIGTVSDHIMRATRYYWATNHNTLEDSICRHNCLDVCRDFNNYARDFNNYF